MKKQLFGELLDKFRADRKMRKNDLAKSAQMNPAHLSRLISGKSGIPTRETVNKLAEALCKDQPADLEYVKRRLLEASGNPQNREELIDDLSDRFSNLLRDKGLSENEIDVTVVQVPLVKIREILLGEEKVEVAYTADISPEQIQTRKDAGEEVIMLDQLSIPTARNLESSFVNIDETASSYLDRHAEDFVTHRRQKRAQSNRSPRKIIRAGRVAEIHVHCSTSKEQEQQLRLISKLITTILKEKIS